MERTSSTIVFLNYSYLENWWPIKRNPNGPRPKHAPLARLESQYSILRKAWTEHALQGEILDALKEFGGDIEHPRFDAFKDLVESDTTATTDAEQTWLEFVAEVGEERGEKQGCNRT